MSRTTLHQSADRGEHTRLVLRDLTIHRRLERSYFYTFKNYYVGCDKLGKIRVQESSGTGPAVLMWPSLLMTGDLWAGQAARFGADNQLVLIDPPGHGGSEPLRAMFSFSECARCVVDLMDGLGIDKAHFVGNSWGGMIGATFAAQHPERLIRAVLMNCTASKAGRIS